MPLARSRNVRIGVPLALPLAVALARLSVGAALPLVPDEAYYWEWSRHLAAGYFDHPPAIALLIRGGTSLLGDTPAGVRLLPQMAGLAGTLACVLLAARLGGEQAARRTALLTASVPLAGLGLVLATPDSPLLAAVALTLVALERAVGRDPRERAAVGWWALGGAGLGLALLSKYTAILLAGGVLIAVLTHRELRRHLAHPGPYVGAAVAAALTIPVLVWNSRHRWVSFAFQLGHGLNADSGSPLRRELTYVGTLALLASPILFALLVSGVGRALRARSGGAAYLLGVVAATWACFFALSALRHRVEPNWAAPAFIAAAPLVALGRVAERGARWLHRGAASGFLLTAVGCACTAVPAMLPARARRPLERNLEWGTLAREVARIRAALGRERIRPWLAADRYQQASELAVTLPDHPTVFSLNLNGRSNQYDLWPGFDQRAAVGDDMLLVLEDKTDARVVLSGLRPHFESVERQEPPAASPDGASAPPRAGHQLWLLRGWRGGWPRSPAAR